MRIHVMGMGSVGTLVAFHLKRTLPARAPVTLMHKTSQRAIAAQVAQGKIRVENNGVAITTIGFDHDIWDRENDPTWTSPPPQQPRNPGKYKLSEEDDEEESPPSKPLSEGARGRSPITSLVVTTKAFSVAPSLRALLPRLSASSTIVLLQNGMGLYEELCTEVFPNPHNRPHIVVAVNNHGTWLKEYMHVVHAGIGNMKLAIMPDGLGRDFEASYRKAGNHRTAKLNLDDIFTSSEEDTEGGRYYSLRYTMQAFLGAEGLHASWLPLYDVQLAKLRKLVVNCVINPLTALLGCRNGEIFEHPSGHNLCHQICKEASAAFHAQWRSEQEAAVAAGKESDSRFPDILTTEALHAEVERIVKMTRMNLSSMLCDVRMARQTELKYLNGYLLGLGQKYNVSMPTNRTLISLMGLRSQIPLRGLL
ncbi:unnamed protein product [Somion occarium]|uniref:2-dehydropantoate 2-reductase n=1 Tax=Somion occarium TaxID=3059160 RepID=A0ABP1CH81_9APHY